MGFFGLFCCSLRYQWNGQPRVSMLMSLIVLVLDIVLNQLFIPSYGVVGAAMATVRLAYWACCFVLIRLQKIQSLKGNVMFSFTMIKFGILKTLEEMYVYTFLFLANLFPDMSVCSVIRALLVRPIASVGSDTRIRKNLYVNSFRKLSIGRNCFIHRACQFDLLRRVRLGSTARSVLMCW
jgi:Na+-driven multidrug efflux pump